MSNIYLRNMQGRLLEIRDTPQTPLKFGNVIVLKDSSKHIVKMQAIVHGRLQINLEPILQ